MSKKKKAKDPASFIAGGQSHTMTEEKAPAICATEEFQLYVPGAVHVFYSKEQLLDHLRSEMSNWLRMKDPYERLLDPFAYPNGIAAFPQWTIKRIFRHERVS